MVDGAQSKFLLPSHCDNAEFGMTGLTFVQAGFEVLTEDTKNMHTMRTHDGSSEAWQPGPIPDMHNPHEQKRLHSLDKQRQGLMQQRLTQSKSRKK